MLEVNNINVYYGAIHAVQGVSFSVDQGDIVTLIGGNGAGKSTILKTISGLIRPESGSITFNGINLAREEAHNIVRLGISHVPEGRRIFRDMSVLENLEMGAYIRHDLPQVKKDMRRVFDLFPRLRERLHQQAGTLSGGEQQMLSTARGLLSKPKLMLLDEPSMGLSPMLVRDIFSHIKEINRGGTTILLVEQNARMALSIAHRGYVMETGRIVMEGRAEDLAGDEKVRKAYLGG
ncbi:MAG: ABC transporter ATP-binding protein [Brevinematales bacterium]|jgi:branched-chain amino acid transport system ATP-binding protein